MDINNVNWEQHKMHEGHVRSLSAEKETKEILMRAIQSGHPMIAIQPKSNHIKIYVKDDGIVTTGGTGGGGRGFANFEAQLRRAHRSVGSDFPRRNESLKKFQERMKKGNKDEQE